MLVQGDIFVLFFLGFVPYQDLFQALTQMSTPAFLTAPAVLQPKRPRFNHGPSLFRFRTCATAGAAASNAPEPSSSGPKRPAVDYALSRIVSERLERDQIDKCDHSLDERGKGNNHESALPPILMQSEILTYHAKVAARKKDWQVAERLYRRALKTNRSDSRTWLGLARLYMRRGETDEARKTFRAAIQSCRNNPYLLQAWGVLEERAFNTGRAKTLYETATRADPTHVPSWVALGLWHQKIGKDLYAARDCFRKGAEGDPSNYYVWHVWGVLERQLGNFQAARRCFASGVAANPGNAATYVVWGVLEEQLQNREVAVDLFHQAHAANPNNVHALVAHAVTLERMGNIIGARTLLRKALTIQSKDAAIYQTFGLLEYRAGDVESARGWFQQGIKANRRHLPVWLSWGVMEGDYGNVARARQLFQDGIWADPKSSNAVRLWHAWAGLERRAGRINSARRLFGHGLRAAPESVAILSCWATMEAEESEDMAFARDLLDKAVRLQPSQRDLWELYERLERDYGSPGRADAILKRSLLCSKQRDHRVIVSDPLPGDYAAGGMWVDTADLHPQNVSALEVVPEAPIEDDTRCASFAPLNQKTQPDTVRQNSVVSVSDLQSTEPASASQEADWRPARSAPSDEVSGMVSTDVEDVN